MMITAEIKSKDVRGFSMYNIIRSCLNSDMDITITVKFRVRISNLMAFNAPEFAEVHNKETVLYIRFKK